MRFAGIAYPQGAALRSGAAVERQWDSCTVRGSHALAESLVHDSGGVTWGAPPTPTPAPDVAGVRRSNRKASSQSMSG